MALLCLISTFKNKMCSDAFYILPERNPILNHLSLCSVELLHDGLLTNKNGLITKYDLCSDEVTFICKLLSEEMNIYRFFPPKEAEFKSVDVIYLV